MKDSKCMYEGVHVQGRAAEGLVCIIGKVLCVVGGAKKLSALSFSLLLHAAGRTALIRPGRWNGGCKGTPAVDW